MYRKTRGEKFGQGWDDALPAIRAKRIIANQIRLPSVRHQTYAAVRPGHIVTKKTLPQRMLLVAGAIIAVALFSTGGVGIVILSSHGVVSLPQAAPSPAQESLDGSPARTKQKALGAGENKDTTVNPSAEPAKPQESAKKPARTAGDAKKTDNTQTDEEAAAKKSPAGDTDASVTTTTPPTPPSAPVTPEEDVAETLAITFDGTAFDITNAMIDRGGTLTFSNDSQSELRLTCLDAASSDLCAGATIAPGGYWSIKPAIAGTWRFHNLSQPATVGTLTVY